MTTRGRTRPNIPVIVQRGEGADGGDGDVDTQVIADDASSETGETTDADIIADAGVETEEETDTGAASEDGADDGSGDATEGDADDGGAPATETTDEAPKPRDPAQRRIERERKKAKAETERADAAVARAEALQSIIDAQNAGDDEEGDRPKLYTEAEALSFAETKALEIANTTAVITATDAMYDKAVAANKEFEAKWQATIGELGGPDVLKANFGTMHALTKFPNGHEMLVSLAADPDKLEDLFAMDRLDQGIELARMSGELAKPKPKTVSKAPAPIVPLETISAEPETKPEKMSMDQYAAWRRDERAKRAEKRAQGYR